MVDLSIAFCMLTQVGYHWAIHALHALQVRAPGPCGHREQGPRRVGGSHGPELQPAEERTDLGTAMGKSWGNGYFAGNHGKWIDYGGYEMVILDRWGLVHPVLKKDIASTGATELTRVNQLTY